MARTRCNCLLFNHGNIVSLNPAKIKGREMSGMSHHSQVLHYLLETEGCRLSVGLHVAKLTFDEIRLNSFATMYSSQTC